MVTPSRARQRRRDRAEVCDDPGRGDAADLVAIELGEEEVAAPLGL
jgi:hypothetical protein